MKIPLKISACLFAVALVLLVAGCQSARVADKEDNMTPAFTADIPPGTSNLVASSMPFSTANSTNSDPDEVIHYDQIVLRSGDVVKISVPSTSSLTGSHLIRRDGNITLEMVGDLRAAGKTLDALKADLIQKYSDKIDTKEFSVELESSRFPVYVTGAVGHPGKVESDHPITALEAIMESGGPDYTRANLRDVRIFRLIKGKYMSMTIDLKAVMKGTSTETIFLKPQDIVYVKEHFTWF